MKISLGSHVTVEFTVKLDDDTVVGSNVGGDPVVFVQGKGDVLPALEQALDGMTAGESKNVKLTAEQAYGPIHQEAIQEIEKDRIPEDAREVGAALQAQSTEGETLEARVVEVRDDVVVADFNHPLAGRDLIFDITILDVKPSGS
jgi:FKBP-type peptidyl-prolyl cis-trans isomerase 2